jgi:hypothetical protein
MEMGLQLTILAEWRSERPNVMGIWPISWIWTACLVLNIWNISEFTSYIVDV